MSCILEKVFEIAVRDGLAIESECLSEAAIHPVLGINGDEGDTFVDALCEEFGDWVANWPWGRFVDFDEPPADWGPKFWKLLHLPNVQSAFPGYVEERLSLGHIAAVLEKGDWFDP